MKRKITSLAIAATMLLATVLPAFAAGGKAPDGGCQVGADNKNILGGWLLFDEPEFVELLVDLVGMDEDVAEQRAEAIWDFNDHNNDGFLCVMNAELPAAGGKWLLIEDNHPYGGP